MATFVLTVDPRHPARGDAAFMASAPARTAAGEALPRRWSVGGRQGGIRPGDTALMLRQHVDRGIVAVGTFVSEVFTHDDWRGGTGPRTYADVEWRTWLPVNGRLSIEQLEHDVPAVTWRYGFRASGNRLPDDAAEAVAHVLSDHLTRLGLSVPDAPDESLAGVAEGGLTRVTVNRYERDQAARAACLAEHGYVCAACDLDFEERYGTIGRGYMQVHHVVPLSRGGERRTDRKDLVPLCPNCHAMVHRGRTDPMPIDVLRQRIAAAALRPHRGIRGAGHVHQEG